MDFSVRNESLLSSYSRGGSNVLPSIPENFHAGTKDICIPRTVFQTWKKKDDIPANFTFWKTRTMEVNPNYKYVVSDDAENRVLVATYAPRFLSIYDKYPKEIYRADVIRYLHLYIFGGVYCDFDVHWIRSIETLPAAPGVILGRMGCNPVHSVPNAIMLSVPRHPFWLSVLDDVLLYSDNRSLRPEYATGSRVLKNSADLFEAGHIFELEQKCQHARQELGITQPIQHDWSSITVLPSPILYPIDWTLPSDQEGIRKPLLQSGRLLTTAEVREKFPDSWAVTYWTHSWESIL